ncbi:MAG: hypothetical protein AMK69_29190 [Nitrospira bacterium SG8_3]|nr:MAG: hypothetical protein AMK69_29190 [Nitrospira bacterium SG8_3]
MEGLNWFNLFISLRENAYGTSQEGRKKKGNRPPTEAAAKEKKTDRRRRRQQKRRKLRAKGLLTEEGKKSNKP